MEFDVLFNFTARVSGCQTFNAFVRVSGDMTIGEMLVEAQEYLSNFIGGGGLRDSLRAGSGGDVVTCDPTDYYIDFALNMGD